MDLPHRPRDPRIRRGLPGHGVDRCRHCRTDRPRPSAHPGLQLRKLGRRRPRLVEAGSRDGDAAGGFAVWECDHFCATEPGNSPSSMPAMMNSTLRSRLPRSPIDCTPNTSGCPAVISRSSQRRSVLLHQRSDKAGSTQRSQGGVPDKVEGESSPSTPPGTPSSASLCTIAAIRGIAAPKASG